ncbi:MAG: NAD(P)/FAD-dependent oxidoreductase [Candidatus Bathyarchaeota archaeon]|nr:NAD(P)/FAD-dependent oxidoreductase [Candidatus Bathyarchaeota archaeon]
MHEFFSDAIVVGGGPCGSFAALNLAKLGVDVNVFEEHARIGVPCHCAGHLSIKGLELLGLYPLPSDIVENSFHGAIFHSPNGRSFHVRFSSPVTCAVNRVLFDKYIARMAEKAGAHYFLNSMVESLIIENSFVKAVIVKRGKVEEKFSAKVVVDAEGISSKILRQASLVAFNRHMLVKAVEAEVENVQDLETDMVEVFLGRDYAPGFYAWLMPKGDGKAKVGLAAKTGNPRELLKRLMFRYPTASKKLRNAKILQTSFHSMTLGGPIPKTFSNGFLVVGDAASHVKPTTGGGVIFGMTCAKIAAEVAYEALSKNDLSSDFLCTYQSRCNKTLGSDVKFMLRIKKMLDALPDDKIDDAINFCARIGLDKALQKFEDIDFQQRSFLRLLRNPRMPIALSYFLLSWLFANR